MDSLVCKNLRVELSKKVILENVSLEAKQGNIYMLLGSNGAGKTTLLRTLSGLIKQAEGVVSINGKDTRSFSRKEFARNICYLPQNHTAVFEYQVIDFVMLGRTAHGNIFYQPNTKDKERAYEMLAEMGIEDLANRSYTHLSSGECQLVMLARALVQDTPFLLLDEPTSNLDFNNQRKVMERITKLAHKNNKAVIISIHDPNAAIEYCDYIIAMNNMGVIKQISKKDEDFFDHIEDAMKEIYDPSIKIIRMENHAFVK
ncbi:ABC transporter ATP-binding protein [Tyzzerella sp. OttesenSCG-928-J15]|nr:ABC transporter ATP-binding protein [Tyzzerella sp. OttesenSCG-928-J15]